jgi:dTMP kinase
MNGKFIVIDGPDGSGKGTQTKKLAERLRAEGKNIEHLSFPRYGKPEAFFIEQFLTGAYGSHADVGPYAASVLFAVERFHMANEIRKMLAEGKIIISDRYVSANKGHHMAKLMDPAERKKFLDWLNNFEYGILNVPKPDKTILLHVPAEIAYDLIGKKDERGYLDGKKRDILEADLEHLKAAEAAYLELLTTDTVESWMRIECTKNSRLLSIEEIHEDLYRSVLPLIG